MAKAKGQICLQILEKQKKIASLECDSSTLVQVPFLIIYLLFFFSHMYKFLAFNGDTLIVKYFKTYILPLHLPPPHNRNLN